MRLDQLLVQKDLVKTRTQAQALIESGAVQIFRDNKWIEMTKPSHPCAETDLVRLTDETLLKYVSRGGLKLEGALKKIQLQVLDKACLDIGLSTGGFTDCLLKAGAKSVVGIDVGKDQLHSNLRNHPNLIFFDELHVKDLHQHSEFQSRVPRGGFAVVVVDVSFISLTHVFKEIVPYISQQGFVLALVKPQFEVGPQGLKRGGLVKDEASYALVQEKIERTCHDLGLTVLEFFPSEVQGKDGNREFFIYLKKGS